MHIELPRTIQNLPQSQQRLVLFSVTFLVALIATLISIGIRLHPAISVMLVVFGPFTVLAFPSGLISFFTQMGVSIQNESSLWFVPFLIYLSVLLPAILIKNKWVFLAMYLIFIILMVMNVTGCSVAAPDAIRKLGQIN